MRRRTLLAALAAFLLPAFAGAQPKTLGTIERKDPRFDALVPKDATIELLADNKFEWSEGPAWDAANKQIIFSDIPRNKIWKWSDAKGLETYLEKSGYSGEAKFTGREPGCNGLAFRDGKLYLCQHGDRRIAVYDGKAMTSVVDKYMGKRFNSPNDLVFAKNGDLYFTDPPYGLPKQMEDPAKELDFQGVYKLGSKGDLTLLTKEMSRPNGIALSPDEKTLYVANSDGKAPIIKAFPLKADGTTGEGKVFFDATPWIGKAKGAMDGLKVDKAGNVWATGPGGVWVFTADGTHLGTLATGVATANVGWGDDGSTLYITADKNLCRVKTKAKGW